MPNVPMWIVCESTGRWTAALRLALARRRGAALGGRIKEVRSLAELSGAANELPSALILIEVQPESFGAPLNWFAQGWQRGARGVALFDAQPLAEQACAALLEAGALAVIDSPRRIEGVLELERRVAVSRRARASNPGGEESIAERAWAALPWQDS